MSDRSGFETVGSRTIADLSFLTVNMRDVRTPDGAIVERVVIEHPGAVAVVPIIDGDILLIEQYRAPVERHVLEIPAGKLDHDGEDRTITANRELEEEVGYRARHLEPLTTIWTSVGFCDEVIHIYLGTDLVEGNRRPVGHEEQSARLVRMPLPDAVDLVTSGVIADAKSIAGILLAAHRGPA
ncbi:MAG: NUDIX hydrolase [Acidimicrobiia bacterium]|nr:NUDIX hydrolase [Acidimicrobiia bacterium]